MNPIVQSSISQVEADRILVRGYDLKDLIGAVSFGEMVFLLLTGELPDGPQGRMIEAILVSSADHGLDAPSTHVTRTAASCGVPVQTAVAAGISVIGESHGGAGEACARLLQESLLAKPEAKPGPLAHEIVADYRQRGCRLPGFGHRQHKVDPRAERLLALCDDFKLSAGHVALARAIRDELKIGSEHAVPLNVDGAMAAILSDLGINWRHGKTLFMIGRSAGLAAQAVEQATTAKPLQFAAPTPCEYTGPAPRALPSEFVGQGQD
jgi:citrate synthase